ncbi:MAG: GTP 3',8-cyclase MoaA [Clostridioides sp.]|jgi:cyclic pyranopterin phosphate synthase|nr:GTP 3',8-cyclase MoaA [Clostridioides sp.]
MIDRQDRNIDYLRISVTDRCNLRCKYCRPRYSAEGMYEKCSEDVYEKSVEDIYEKSIEISDKSWVRISNKSDVPILSETDILTFDEILDICKAGANLGISKIKITGGEPLLRNDIEELIRDIKLNTGIKNITMTTNSIFLKDKAKDLKEAGLDAINISLDTIDKVRYRELTGYDEFENVKEGIESAIEAGIDNIKLNCVAWSGNEDELVDIAKIAKESPIHVRFIEMMPLGYGRDFAPIYQDEIISRLEKSLGRLIPCEEELGNGPAVYYEVQGFAGKIGFISAISHMFCRKCNRVRLTADGMLKTCLNYDSKVSLRDYLRSGASAEELQKYMYEAIYNKPTNHDFENLEEEKREKKNMGSIGG